MRVEPVERDGLRHGDAQALEARRPFRRKRRAAHDLVQDTAACDAVGERPDRVERLRQREGALARHARRSRLVAGDAAESGGDAAGAAGIGANTGEGHAVRHRNRGARRGAARNPARGGALVRRSRRAVMRVEAEAGEGELGHVGAAHHDEAGAAQPGDRRSVALGRGGIRQHRRAGRGRFAGKVEQVLHRDRDAGEARRGEPGAPQLVHRLGGGERRLAMDLDEGQLPLPVRGVDPGESLAHEGERARPAGGEIVGKGGKGASHGRIRPGRSNGFRGAGSRPRT